MDLLVGESPSIKQIKEQIEEIADTDLNVLIRGESGVGKDLVARTLHEQSSNRRNNPMIKVNCVAIPAALMESELFGHEKGAFTDAHQTKIGKFEAASDGTIFLDEIGDMPLPLQAKLLQVLQDKKFMRVGGVKEISINTWVLSATNHDLTQDIQAGNFRQDLYYRLNIAEIVVPPLRERIEDLPLLIDHFINKHKQCLKGRDFTFPEKAMRLFQAYSWPGNVRELENYVRKFMVVKDVNTLYKELLREINSTKVPPNSTPNSYVMDLSSVNEVVDKIISGYTSKSGKNIMIDMPPLKQITKESIAKIEKAVITEVLQLCGWNKKVAAKQLQICYKALLYKLKQYNIKDH